MPITSARLTKGMYGHEFRSQSNLFGITCGQIRGRDFVHNGGWYNQQGEKLGWGDLSVEDFRRISAELEEGEMFVILCESDSFWAFVEKPGLIGSMAQVKPDVEAPGAEYVAQKAMYIIVRGELFFVARYHQDKPLERDGLVFQPLAPEAAKEMVLRG